MEASHFFLINLDPRSAGAQALALLLATILGGMIGYEREMRGQPAGLRTHIIVCVGAALITIVSQAFGNGEAGMLLDNPARIAANVVVGVGFLGAGAIVREGVSVHGLTTAASIWTVAAIGMTVGTSPRMGEIGVLSTFIVLGTLTILNTVEDKLGWKHSYRNLTVVVKDQVKGAAEILETLSELNITVSSMSRRASESYHGAMDLSFHVEMPENKKKFQLMQKLASEDYIIAYKIV